MDLSQLSNDDLLALRSGDLSKVSDAGLQSLKSSQRAKKVAEQQTRDRELYDPTKGMSTTDKVLTGIGAGMTSVGRALGLGGAAEAMGLPGTREEAAINDAALNATTAGKVGDVIGRAATVAPTMLIPGANTAVGAGLIGLGTGAATTEGGLKDRAIGAGLGAVGGVGGNLAGKALGKAVDKYIAADAAKVAEGAQRNAAVTAARDAGYTLPPTEIKPTATAELLEGLSGKIKTAQAASTKNQAVTNSLAKRALGVADDAPLTKEALQEIRKGAGKAYESIRGVGRIEADDAYRGALNALKSQYEGAAKDFPELASNDVSKLVSSIEKPSFGADSAIDAIRVLREGADKAFRSGDTGLAKANKGAAQALEDLIERNLANSNPEKLGAFRDARKTIAKTYSVEKALNPETGDVSAPALAALLKKGKPLSGDLETIAKTATAFPRATQALKEPYRAISPLDYATGIIGGTASGNPLALAAILGRPGVRSALLSKPYQSMLSPKDKPAALARLLANTDGDIAERLTPSVAAILAAQAGQQ